MKYNKLSMFALLFVLACSSVLALTGPDGLVPPPKTMLGVIVTGTVSFATIVPTPPPAPILPYTPPPTSTLSPGIHSVQCVSNGAHLYYGDKLICTVVAGGVYRVVMTNRNSYNLMTVCPKVAMDTYRCNYTVGLGIGRYMPIINGQYMFGTMPSSYTWPIGIYYFN